MFRFLCRRPAPLTVWTQGKAARRHDCKRHAVRRAIGQLFHFCERGGRLDAFTVVLDINWSLLSECVVASVLSAMSSEIVFSQKFERLRFWLSIFIFIWYLKNIYRKFRVDLIQIKASYKCTKYRFAWTFVSSTERQLYATWPSFLSVCIVKIFVIS